MNNWCKKLLLISCLFHRSAHAFSAGKMRNNNVISTRTRNDDAQQIFEIISTYCNTSREEFMKDPAWKRTKRYIYHATTSTNCTLSVDQVESVLRILDMFHKKVATSILQSVPRILRKDPQNHLKPTVSFLNEFYGELFDEAMRRNPNLLLTSGLGYNSKRKTNSDNVHDDMSLEDLLVHQQLLSDAQIEKLKVSHPSLFQLSVTKVQSNVEFLLHTLGGSSVIVSRLIRANPNILSLSTSNLKSKISFLRTCGFDSDVELVQIMKKFPGLLGLSLEHNLKPTTDMIRRVVEQYESNPKSAKNLLHKSLSLHPNLLALSPQNFDDKTKYFDSICESDEDTSPLSARILVTVPSVFSLSLSNNIQLKIDYFRMLWHTPPGDKSTSHTISKYLYEYPNVLSLSLEGNIQPTVNFYNRTGYISLDDSGQNKSSAMLPPRYIATSLSRLLSRWNFYLAQESQQRKKGETVIKSKPPLHILATATDQKFCLKMGYDFSVYSKYKEELEPRLKFNYQFETWLKTGLPIM